jgi:ubiquitin C-terminal hydrolase
LKNINNEQLIYLSLILTKLHEELNINQLPDSNYLRKDFNEINCLNSFMQNYKKNKSIIQDIFFGIEESIIICNICGLSQYFFDIYKLIYFELKKEQQPFNLQNSILEWENHLIPTKYDCPKCQNLLVMPIITKIVNLSDILIIAIINKDKIKIDFKTIIRTSNFEYKLLSFINENGNNLDIIYYSKEKFFIMKNDNNLEEIEISQVNLYPIILFYEKENAIEPTNNNIINIINTNNSEVN